ncbi:hypothetical protein [Streptomyces exfoliatus]|uniref:hypothetical protein n=1 Tax=Streptomyces exfoliatus TaxID=1905 RepID=UPI0012FF0456|nr:hypothetical protein [Streptomyces exfoliatus]
MAGLHLLADGVFVVHRATSPTLRARRLNARRRRSPAGAPPGTPRRPRGLGDALPPWATALSALAAAIGLFFSATVAASSVDATRRQLDQDERGQAGRVGYWIEWLDEVPETVTLVNRSLDPVTSVELWWYAPDAGIDLAEHEWVFMGFETLPPSTRLVITPREIDDYLSTFFGIKQGRALLKAIQFVDSDGRQWLRDPMGLRAAEHKPQSPEEEGGFSSNGQWFAEGEFSRREPAEHCDK